jgi:hypothetical protein
LKSLHYGNLRRLHLQPIFLTIMADITPAEELTDPLNL